MSLTMIALRICAVEALKSADTLVGDRVLDSQISAIDQTPDGKLSTDQQKPFIAVYTDSAVTDLGGHDGLRPNGKVELLFNFGVSVTMVTTDKETGASLIIGELPPTDANFEAVLDVLDTQILRALVSGTNTWAQIFGSFVKDYAKKSHLRSSAANENVRLAAGQTKLIVETYADPILGAPLAEGGRWQVFLEQMDKINHPQRGLFKQALGIASDPIFPPYEELAAMTTQVADTLGLKPHAGVDPDTKISLATTSDTPDEHTA